MKKETAQKAAKWWADQLRTKPKLDNGDDSLAGILTSVVAYRLQEKEYENRKFEDANKFEIALAEILELENDERGVILSVDYNPDYLLSKAIKNVNINVGQTRLPWKTTMWITKNKIEVAYGYRGKQIEI